MTNARETAKRAFKGQDVKLREEFQVGVNKPNDLGSVLQRARIVLASLQKAANTAALAGKGWLAADTQTLEAAIEAFDEGVLGWFAWCCVMPLNARLAAPDQHGVGSQLGAVIADDHAGLATFGDEIGQLANDPLA